MRQLTKPVQLPEMNVLMPKAITIRSSDEFQFPLKSLSIRCEASCSEEDPGSRKDTSLTCQEGEEYFQAFQPNPLLLMKQLSCQELDFLSF